MTTETKEKQIHILIGCADARDLRQPQLDAVDYASKTIIPARCR